MYSMFAYSLKLYGFKDGVEDPSTKWQGPFSWNKPIMELQPGPPLNQVARGAVVGLSLDSKNQNHMYAPATHMLNRIHVQWRESLLATVRYPEYWFTPAVVSQIPELVTKSIEAPVASCSNTVRTTPSSSYVDRFPLR